MRIFIRLFVAVLASGYLLGSLPTKVDSSSEPASILIFTKTEGFRHQSIPDGVEAVKEITSKHRIATLHTENSSYFQPDSLTKFDAVLFLSTSGNILNEHQQEALKVFLRQGGGYIGIHGASATESNWSWYGNMVGASFIGHPKIQEATITVKNKNHPSTSFLPNRWTRVDEWYNFDSFRPHINVLLNLDESTYQGGKHGANHPIAWYHHYEGSRVFYTALGHTKESFSDSLFRRHLWGGIKYVLQTD